MLINVRARRQHNGRDQTNRTDLCECRASQQDTSSHNKQSCKHTRFQINYNCIIVQVCTLFINIWFRMLSLKPIGINLQKIFILYKLNAATKLHKCFICCKNRNNNFLVKLENKTLCFVLNCQKKI